MVEFSVCINCLGLCCIGVLKCVVRLGVSLVVLILCSSVVGDWLFILFGLNSGLWICLVSVFV